MATFGHSHPHYKQDVVKDLRFGSLAPREEGGEFGGATPKDAMHQVSVAHTLLSFSGWGLVENQHGDVLQMLVDGVEARRSDLEAEGVNVDQVLQSVVA